jgi:hypothetical protein
MLTNVPETLFPCKYHTLRAEGYQNNAKSLTLVAKRKKSIFGISVQGDSGLMWEDWM